MKVNIVNGIVKLDANNVNQSIPSNGFNINNASNRDIAQILQKEKAYM